MNIIEAIEYMRSGGMIKRKKWNKGQYIKIFTHDDGFESIVDNDCIPYYDSRAEFLVSIIDSLLRENNCWEIYLEKNDE